MQTTPFLPQQWTKPFLVLIAPTHGGMARLSGLDKYWGGRPAIHSFIHSIELLSVTLHGLFEHYGVTFPTTFRNYPLPGSLVPSFILIGGTGPT